MKKQIGIFVVILILVGGGAFYGGMTYGKSLTATSGSRNANAFRVGGAAGGQGRFINRTVGAGGGFVSGDVLSIGNNSITVQMMDGSGSKIVYFTSTTPLMHMVAAPVSDLKVGDRVTVTGAADASGTVTAQTIQVRPASSTFPGGAVRGN